MKSKQPTFKNPFDLIEEEEEEPMSMPTKQKYVPPTSNVHAPLPFNPYEITKEPLQPAKHVTMVQPSPPVYHPYQPVEHKDDKSKSFTSPFGQEESQSTTHAGQPYQSQSYQSPQKVEKEYELDQNGDPPLLQDIGVEPDKVKERIMLILKLGQPNADIIQDPDLSGPIAIALAFGCLLLFAGKIHFADIYAMFIFGNLLIYFLLNFISQHDIVPLYSIMSTMGYGLLPMLGLGFLGVFMSLKTGLGIGVALAAAAWSSLAAGNFMDVLIQDSKDRKLLVIYPLFLFYVSFTMIVIF